MQIVLIVLISILILLVFAMCILIITGNKSKDFELMERRINDNIQDSVKLFRDTLSLNQENIGKIQTSKFHEMDIIIKDMYDTMENKLEYLNKNMNEMHSLAVGIDDLKRVLSNVKTRGILGEIQLEAILDEILSREQYEKNVATIPNSRSFVEFAVKLPGNGENSVYLPVDSKFPLDLYTNLCNANDSGDTEKINAARKELITRLKSFAKDIHTKYVSLPYTTDFAIMFLPIEGLYLEAVNCGLVEILQREYKINIAGPSTFAAMLNALQMGFRTLAIEKHSVHIQDTLNEVRSEFEKFSDTLSSTQQYLRRADAELDKLVGTRTRAIMRKLRDVSE